VRKKNKKIRKKKSNREKNQLNRLNLKKSTSSVRFWFYKPKIEKSEPNPNKKNQAKPEKTKPKPSQTGLNRFFPKNQTETDQFEPVSVLKKN
jgi:hypothetical protein